MCYHPKHICVKNPSPSFAFPESHIELDVPCGHCVACLKRRQLDYSTRLYREVKDSSSMFFVTLTYNNTHLPIARRQFKVDVDTGEMFESGGFEFVEDEALLSELRGEFSNIKASSKPRYIQRTCLNPLTGEPLVFDNCYYMARFTPSLKRSDVKNWIKGCRVQYERDFGVKLEFTYAWCGEYGPRGTRPHYHLIFLNLNREQVDYMCRRWSDTASRGYTYYKEVPAINPDGSNARQLACRYIGKYVSKGKFDNEAVKLCDAQKGRLCNSKRFGTKDFSYEEISYFRAYDLFGPYDINSFQLCNQYVDVKPSVVRFLTDEQRKQVAAEVFKRSHYTIHSKDGNEFTVPLPRAFRKYIFYVEDYVIDKDYKKSFQNWCLKDSVYHVKKRRIASALSRSVMDYISDMVAESDKREFERFCASWHISEDDSEAYVKFIRSKEATDDCIFEALEENKLSLAILQDSKDGQ